MQIENGRVTVECRYSVKVGRPNYSSEEASMTFGVQFDAVGDTNDLIAQAGQLEDMIMASLKLGVGTELRIPIRATQDGPQFDFGKPVSEPVIAPAPQAAQPQPYIAPVVPMQPPPAAPPAAGPGGEFGPPKATKEQVAVLPRFQADLGGGVETYIDQRSLKKTAANPNAPYSAKAPDFKNAVDNDDVYWLVDNRGTVNAAVHAGLAAAMGPAPDNQAPF